MYIINIKHKKGKMKISEMHRAQNKYRCKSQSAVFLDRHGYVFSRYRGDDRDDGNFLRIPFLHPLPRYSDAI